MKKYVTKKFQKLPNLVTLEESDIWQTETRVLTLGWIEQVFEPKGSYRSLASYFAKNTDFLQNSFR